MVRIHQKVLLLAGLSLVSVTNAAVAYAAGRQGQGGLSGLGHAGLAAKSVEDAESLGTSGMCIIQNFACKDSDARSIRSFSNINNQAGCDEKCSETEGCQW